MDNQTNTDLDVLETNGWRLGTGAPPALMTGDPEGDACDDNDFFPDVDEQRIYASAGFAAEQLVPCLSAGNSDPWPPDVSPVGRHRLAHRSAT